MTRDSALAVSATRGIEIGIPAMELGEGVVRVGLSLNRRGGYRYDSDSAYAESKNLHQGIATVSAAADSATETRIDATSLMLNIYYDARGLSSMLGGAYPWFGAGVGWSRANVRAYSTHIRGSIHYEAPGSTNDSTINGRIFVAEDAFDGVGWQVMAGASLDLAPSWVLSAGYRYVVLGDYRLRARSDFAKIKVVDNSPPVAEALRFDFPSKRTRLDAHELLISLRFEFWRRVPREPRLPKAV